MTGGRCLNDEPAPVLGRARISVRSWGATVTQNECAHFLGGRINVKQQSKELSAAVSNTFMTYPPGDLDGYVTTADVCDLTRYSRRWLNILIRDGRFPKPDIPSSGTNTNRWRRSTIRKALDAMAGIVSSGDPN